MDTAPASRRSRHGATWWVRLALGLALIGVGPIAALSTPVPPIAEATSPAFEPIVRTAAWPPWLRGRRTLFGGSPPAPAVPDTPHPAVARIVVPEANATAYGTGTLEDVRDQFGLVVTNWHVVRDSRGVVVEVEAPAETSDLAALTLGDRVLNRTFVMGFPPHHRSPQTDREAPR